MIIEHLGSVELLQLAFVHDGNTGCHGHGFGLVVGDVDEGGFKALMQLGELSTGLNAQFGIEVGQRLIEEEYFRLADDRADQRQRAVFDHQKVPWVYA